MKRSFKLITLFNIPIEINFTWFIILGLVVFTLARGYFPYTNPTLSTGLHWLMALVAALLLFASLLAHELSHAVVAMKYKLPIRGITLFIFGGVAQMEKEPSSPTVEFKMAIAGPIMSFFLSFVFYVLTFGLEKIGFSAAVIAITYYLYILNLVIGLFNLIPGFPLDGGRVLRAILWYFYKDLQRATGIASSMGKGFAFLLIMLGLLNLFTGSLINGIWLIFIGLFLSEAADTSYRQVAMKNILSGIRVENLMTRSVVTVPTSITLDKLVDDYFFKYRHASFPVMEDDIIYGLVTVPTNITLDKLVNDYFFKYRHASFPVMEDDIIYGLVTLHDIKEVPREKWGQTTAKEVMLPLSRDITIHQKADIMSALTKMARAGFGRLLVVEDSKLIGIISQRDIMRLFEFKEEIGG